MVLSNFVSVLYACRCLGGIRSLEQSGDGMTSDPVVRLRRVMSRIEGQHFNQIVVLDKLQAVRWLACNVLADRDEKRNLFKTLWHVLVQSVITWAVRIVDVETWKARCAYVCGHGPTGCGSGGMISKRTAVRLR